MSSLSDDDFFDRVFSPVFGEGAGAEEEEVGFFVGVVEEGMGGRNRPVFCEADSKSLFLIVLGPV